MHSNFSSFTIQAICYYYGSDTAKEIFPDRFLTNV